MFRFSLDMLISNLVDFSLFMTLNFGDKLRAQKKILSAVAGTEESSPYLLVRQWFNTHFCYFVSYR